MRVLHRFLNALDLPIITIGLAQGDALGGGFESLLSFNVIIAERGAKFGFPESMFGLFPGMGAYSLVSRRVGAAFAEEMMLTGRIYSADEMKEVGLVHMVVEPGRGIEAARDFMQKNKRRHVGGRAVYKVGHVVNPVTPRGARRHRADLGGCLPGAARARSQDHAAPDHRPGQAAIHAGGGIT